MDVGFDFTGVEPLRHDATRNILFTPERARLFVPGTVLLSHELVPDKEMERSEFYRELVGPLFFLMAAPLLRHGTSVRGFGVQRERYQGPFGERERRLLQELSPCLIRAENDEQAGRRADILSKAKSEIFYTQNEAIILVDQDGNFLVATALAEEVLGQRGSLLSIRRGRIHIASGCHGEKLLLELVHTVALSGVGQSTVLQREGSPAIAIELRRVIDDPSSLRAAPSLPQVVALYVTKSAGLTATALQRSDPRLTDLPRRLREVAHALTETSMSIKEIAEHLGVKVGTAEKHVERLYDALGVHSRAELVQRMR